VRCHAPAGRCRPPSASALRPARLAGPGRCGIVGPPAGLCCRRNQFWRHPQPCRVDQIVGRSARCGPLRGRAGRSVNRLGNGANGAIVPMRSSNFQSRGRGFESGRDHHGWHRVSAAGGIAAGALPARVLRNGHRARPTAPWDWRAGGGRGWCTPWQKNKGAAPGQATPRPRSAGRRWIDFGSRRRSAPQVIDLSNTKRVSTRR